MNERLFAPGFRLSAFDVLILVGGTGAAIALATVHLWTGLAVGFVVAHFFLFCNVLRMSRRLELIWAAVFTALAVGAGLAWLSWKFVFPISLAVTLVLAVTELRLPSYHGVGWKRINPRLPEWWESTTNNPHSSRGN
ncbi:MAG TPA: hypothetical protein VJU16_06355 [Planctomycetota bacterium]|nr:hypothetical protein [Planctomycetota bacterium]